MLSEEEKRRQFVIANDVGEGFEAALSDKVRVGFVLHIGKSEGIEVVRTSFLFAGYFWSLLCGCFGALDRQLRKALVHGCKVSSAILKDVQNEVE